MIILQLKISKNNSKKTLNDFRTNVCEAENMTTAYGKNTTFVSFVLKNGRFVMEKLRDGVLLGINVKLLKIILFPYKKYSG